MFIVVLCVYLRAYSCQYVYVQRRIKAIVSFSHLSAKMFYVFFFIKPTEQFKKTKGALSNYFFTKIKIVLSKQK